MAPRRPRAEHGASDIKTDIPSAEDDREQLMLAKETFADWNSTDDNVAFRNLQPAVSSQ